MKAKYQTKDLSSRPQICLNQGKFGFHPAIGISKYRVQNAKFIENFSKMVWMTWNLLLTPWLKFTKYLLLLEQNPAIEDLDSAFLMG